MKVPGDLGQARTEGAPAQVGLGRAQSLRPGDGLASRSRPLAVAHPDLTLAQAEGTSPYDGLCHG
ncbi:hypothetical protein [Streptomyces coeruleorubidus]|uniref:hypothetical protein n=1 Tax=Streptomyces coeruleorubidus TaxID=116188 RepID=UPI00364A8F44